MSEELEAIEKALKDRVAAGDMDIEGAGVVSLLCMIAKQLERIADAMERAADDAGELVQ